MTGEIGGFRQADMRTKRAEVGTNKRGGLFKLRDLESAKRQPHAGNAQNYFQTQTVESHRARKSLYFIQCGVPAQALVL